MKAFIYRNSLSLAFLVLMLGSLVGQFVTGLHEYNDWREEHALLPIDAAAYFFSGHFLQATFENWESEFFQMALFVILTIWLRQKGSSESRELEKDDKAGECIPKKNSPWALRTGGFFAWFYQFSLSASLILLFLVSFIIHWYGSWEDYNLDQTVNQLPTSAFIDYLFHPRFWFESFQNWQSEFLSVFAIIFLSVYLRQKGSSQSKKVNEPHSKTGE